MSNYIYIDREELDAVIEYYKKKIDEVRENFNDVISSINMLEDGWDGDCKKMFFEDVFPKCETYMANTVDELYCIVDNLEQIKSSFFEVRNLSNELKNLESIL